MVSRVALPPLILNMPNCGAKEETELSVGRPFREKFKNLRDICKIEDVAFLKSLEELTTLEENAGKSGASLERTQDKIFIKKEITEGDYKSFEKMSAYYFKYLTEAIKKPNVKTTCLAKIFEIFEIKRGSTTKYHMVMENLSRGENIRDTYDLKGKFGRVLVSDSEVEVAQQYIEEKFANEDFCVTKSAKEKLKRVVVEDCKFLKKCNIVDYSLLVGVDDVSKELVCRIIDYLGEFNFRKKAEWTLKTFRRVFTKVEPTVKPPGSYMNRFIEFIDTNFKLES